MSEEIKIESKETPAKQVKEIQVALNDKGFECKIDGQIGPVTTTAIKRYQSTQRSRLKVDGVAGEKTLALLLAK